MLLRPNTKALQDLANEKKWSIPELANKLSVDYSYLYRVLNKEKNGGNKLFSGIYSLCKVEKLNIEEYIFFDNPLSVDNDTQSTA